MLWSACTGRLLALVDSHRSSLWLISLRAHGVGNTRIWMCTFRLGGRTRLPVATHNFHYTAGLALKWRVCFNSTFCLLLSNMCYRNNRWTDRSRPITPITPLPCFKLTDVSAGTFGACFKARPDLAGACVRRACTPQRSIVTSVSSGRFHSLISLLLLTRDQLVSS